MKERVGEIVRTRERDIKTEREGGGREGKNKRDSARSGDGEGER